MLFMATNRRKVKGAYGDAEQSKKRFDCLYGYNHKARGEDGFEKAGRQGFEKALLAELKRLQVEAQVNTPKVGLYLHGYNNSYQESIDEIYDLEERLSQEYGYKPVIVGFSWPSTILVLRAPIRSPQLMGTGEAPNAL